MFIEQSNKIVRMFWHSAIWRMDKKEKSVYITFDDGPNPQVTPQTLEILERYNIKATFFCVGDNVRKHPDVFQQITKRGHVVGNHTMHHIKGFSSSLSHYLTDVAEANDYIHSTLMRPPYGRITFRQMKQLQSLGYSIVMWDVITRDYNPKLTPQDVLNIVKRYTRNGSIIVFHDSLKASARMIEALPQAIEWLISEGYQFKTLEK